MKPEDEAACRALGATDDDMDKIGWLLRRMDGEVISIERKGDNGEIELLHRHPAELPAIRQPRLFD